jgi:hypothetical protein
MGLPVKRFTRGLFLVVVVGWDSVNFISVFNLKEIFC